MDKTTKAASFDFSTIVAGAPSFRDEGLECDTDTFSAQGKHVMWSKEAAAPQRAQAFEIPFGSCGVGGQPASVGGTTELLVDGSDAPGNAGESSGSSALVYAASLAAPSSPSPQAAGTPAGAGSGRRQGHCVSR